MQWDLFPFAQDAKLEGLDIIFLNQLLLLLKTQGEKLKLL